MRAAVFFDRDGTLVRLVQRDGRILSPRSLEDFMVLPGARDVVRRLRARGFSTFVVTNQPDVARGLLSDATLGSMHGRLRSEVELDDVAVCPHDDADHCLCRKPQPGMLIELAERWHVDLGASYMVGDSWRDVEAGRRAGCRTVLLGAGEPGGVTADCVASDLEAVATLVGAPDRGERRER